MISKLVNLIAYRLYLDSCIEDMTDILNMQLPNDYGLVLLCGRQSNRINNFKKSNIISTDSVLKKKWNILYLGEGKKGYNLPWHLLFQLIKRHKDINYFILSDADKQIGLSEIRNVKINNGTKVLLPQRRVRNFGEFTFERNIIEDIENAFIRISTGETNISDLQSSLFMLHRSVVEKVDFTHIKKYKWIGDLYLIEQVIKNKFDIQLFDVNVSKNHDCSSIFDYTGSLNEILMGIPVLKMRELVDYTGISLNRVKNRMLKYPKEFLPTFFKYSNNKKGFSNSLKGIRRYMDFIINLYYKTADIYQIKL